MPNLKCWLFGHKWNFQKNSIICTRCPAFMVRQMFFGKDEKIIVAYNANYAVFTTPKGGAIDYRVNTIVPLKTLQVAEAACREAGYNKTAKELRKCLTPEK